MFIFNRFNAFDTFLGYIGLLIATPMLFAHHTIILLENGFVLSDPVTAMRDKYIGFYRKRRKSIKYDSLKRYELNKNTITFYI